MTEANPTPAGAEELDPRRWLALVVLLTASLIDVIDVTIVNIAMPDIRTDTGASYAALQWISAGYALAFAVGLITGGRLGDIYGRKRMVLTGIGVFTLASALCAAAANPEMLIGARVLQGAGAALMVPQVLSIIHVTFPDHERGKVFGMFGGVIGMGAVIGPIVGALLVESDLGGLGWRSIFLLNLPLGLAGLVLGRMHIAESRAPQALRLDPVGIALASVGLLMLFLPLTVEQARGTWAPVLLIGSLVVFGVFLRYEQLKSRRDNSPVVELSLFKVRSFAAGIGVQLSVSAACGVFLLAWTLYLQFGLGWSPLKTGLTSVPNAVATSVAAGVAMQKLMAYGRKVLQAGALVMASGALLYGWEAVHYGAGIQPWQMILPLAVMGTGMGLIIAPLTGSVLSQVPFQHAGSASGLINTANQLGIALGVGLASVPFLGVVGDVTPVAGRQNSPEVFGQGFSDSLWWVAGGLLIAFLLMLLLPGTAPQPGAMPAPAEPAEQGEPTAQGEPAAV
ncbi:EmrB/QacA subfamily drug resistance transporter [Streptomyces sp. 1114.5]|uniref:MFS transporter n=1 Tax=unclassified Streptomyces TaxID=2593676 RepID=UPI000BD69C84|nr:MULTISPECIES: MFS transporter [unclassified Streptomyces]RKT17047.1 EmrB/QacA subfamily drug resistance transporter [Streptomyces sp. 1114.5]SOB83258.1 drug resistance transporter, EmrB/QacA subfamily [Streptomyces sp. 1331.2]